MTSKYEVISTFLDDGPFDPQVLADALSDPAGRELLVDLLTLRRIVQPNHAVPALRRETPMWRFGWRVAAAAAALFVALAGGYFFGARSMVALTEAPAPTRIVQAVPFSPNGGIQ